MDDLVEVYPILSLLGVAGIAEDTIGIPEPVGLYRITGKPHYYVWVPGAPIYKDTSAAHDGSEWSYECPFLKPDPGDGTRPCALVGSKEDGIWQKQCAPYPPTTFSEEHAAEWTWSFPGCSYTWIEE